MATDTPLIFSRADSTGSTTNPLATIEFFGGIAEKTTSPLKTETALLMKDPSCPSSAFSNTGIALFSLGSVLLLLASFARLRKEWEELLNTLLGGKTRRNLFSEKTPLSPIWRVLLLLVFFIGFGLLFSFYLSNQLIFHSSRFFWITTLGISAILAFCFCFKLLLFQLIGWSFRIKGAASLWREGYIASLLLCALWVILPVLISVFAPPLTAKILWIALFGYLATRILFYYRNIVIFLRDLRAVLYFILYLCALEIAPLLYTYKAVLFWYEFVNLRIVTL